jgi:hypothetical protein
MSPRARRRIAIVVLALLVPVALWSAWDYIEARRLSSFVKTLQARGEPVQSAASRRPHVYPPPTRSAGVYYEAAGLLMDRAGLSEIENALFHGRGDRAELMGRLRTWLEENAEAERLLDEGTHAEFNGFRFVQDNYRIDRLMSVSSIARARVLERVSAADGDGAAEALYRQLRISRAMPSDQLDWLPFQIERALGELGNVLDQRPSAEVMERVQHAIHVEDRDSYIHDDLVNSRALVVESIWRVSSDWYSEPGVRWTANPLEPLATVAARPWIAHRVNGAARRLDALATAARAPWPERLKMPPVPMPMLAASRWRFLDTYADTIEYLRQRRAETLGRMLAGLRTAESAIAVERYRRSHGGALPPSLDALVPAFLDRVPVDPYSGAPVKFRQFDNHYAVYSFGTNFKDDGGGELKAPRTPPTGNRDRLDLAPDLGTRVSFEKP